MSEPMYRDWILDSIDSLRSRKARPDLERICRMVRRRHGSAPEQTSEELEKLIQEQTVLKVNYKGSISYRNAAKVVRRSRKKDDQTTKRTAVEEANHSDLSNGDSALGPIDQDETEHLENEVPVSMETDSTM
ncbi:sterile alpha motif domain-containing protein 1-like [Salmo salar]|nr:sterile alpha motif domain-containing protein 1-like [Salmo salar]